MNTKISFIGGVIVVIIVGTMLFFLADNEGSETPQDSAGLVIGANVIYVAEQAPSRTLSVALVRLEKPGFVVVHEDAAGASGGILGASGVLTAGESNNLEPIPLSRLTRDGETLYVMLHLDDGDGVFDAVKDKPVIDTVSALPMMMIVNVSVEAIEPSAVNP
jgi:hypothetical protein